MKKGSLLIFVLLLTVIGLVLTYTVILPKAMETRVDSMKKYLIHEGYPNPEVIKMNGFTKTVDFKSNKDTVSVRFSRNGLFQIVY